MENSYNYAALIQMAVTFCFLFVALQKNEVLKRVVDFISMMLQNIRKEKEQYYNVMTDLMPGYSLNECPDYLIKDYKKINKSLTFFNKLIHWNPMYMSPWCLYCGLYGLILLFLFAELSEVSSIMNFFLIFIELSTIVNFIYFAIELYNVFFSKEGKTIDCSYGKSVFILIMIFFICLFFSAFELSIGQLFISPQIIFYWSIILAFMPFIMAIILAFIFASLGYIYSDILYERIEAFNTDYNSEIRKKKQETVFGFGSPKSSEGFTFK
jgi:hypothetical protein